MALVMAIGSVLAVSNVSAAEVAGDALSIYGKLHLSIDASDKDDGSATASNTSISSNSSRLGFKGKHDLNNGMAVIWQVETEVDPVSTGMDLASRNSFAGLKGNFGTVILGHHDTPFKAVGGNWDLFGDTIGDRRAILGASHDDNNKLNNRGKNALMYSNSFGSIELQAMYSTDGEDSANGVVDNNNNDMTSLALMYKEGPLSLAVAQESWKSLSTFGGVDGTRVAAGYVFGEARVGAIYETTKGTAGTSDQWSRDVMGVNAAYKMMADTTLKLQYLSAGDSDVGVDTGATMTTVGLSRKMDKQTELYLAYTATKNDTNAKFQAVDGGHGDEVKTIDGGSPSAFSAGMVYKF